MCNRFPWRTVAATALLLTSTAAPGYPRQAPPIQDNSFLIEEAYNQEAGVVQHISLFQRSRHGAGWVFGFTQEWPMPGLRHQIGFTVPVVRSDLPGIGQATGAGDLLVNYRYQALGGGDGSLWVAPRASLIVPSGSWRHARGDGSLGLQLAVPASVQLSSGFAAHLNANLSLHHRARNPEGAQARLASLSGGASLIWLPRPGLNLLTEFVVEDGAEVVGAGAVGRQAATFLVPGVRWAHNLKGGVQVVPGIGYALGLGNAREDSALLVYLSVEHSFRR